MSVLELSIRAANDPLGTPLITLTDADVATFQMRVAENSLGAGSFTIRRDHPDATDANLAPDNYVVVTIPAISDDPIFGFWLEHHDDVILAQAEEGGEVLKREGPGSLAIIGRAAFLDDHYAPAPPASDDRGSGNEIAGYWRWQHKQYGQIFVRLIEEGQNEPGTPLQDVTLDFDRDVDSDGVDWPAIDRDVRFEIGTDGLTFMDRFAATGEVFITMDPDLQAHARQARGTDRHSATFTAGKVRFEKGVNIQTELVKETDTPMAATHAMVIGMENSFVRVTSPSYTSGPGKWITSHYDNSNDTGVLGKVGLEALARGVSELNAIDFEIKAGDSSADGLYLPFRHFDVSDLCTIHTGTSDTDYDEVTARITAFTIALRDATDDTAKGSITGDDMAARSLIVGVETGGAGGSFGIDLNVKVEEKGCGGCPEPPPIDPTPGEPECADSIYPATPSGYYPPLNNFTSDSDMVVYYGAVSFPVASNPTAGLVGALPFAELGSGGSPDFSGDCASGMFRIMVVGSGILTVHTAQYHVLRTLRSQLGNNLNPSLEAAILHSAGEDQVFVIDVDATGDCVNWVDVTDNGSSGCGDKFGFAGATWVATSGAYPIPVSGQPVHYTFTGDGSTTSYTTPGAIPYRPLTLKIKVGGLYWTASLTEVDPNAGTYTLAYAPPLGSTVELEWVYP